MLFFYFVNRRLENKIQQCATKLDVLRIKTYIFSKNMFVFNFVYFKEKKHKRKLYKIYQRMNYSDIRLEVVIHVNVAFGTQ